MKMVEQVFLLFLTVLSSYFDLRYRKIPNYLLLLALPAIVSRAYQGEVHDVLVIIVFTSMLHFFAYLRGWLGGGDVKFALSLALALGRLFPLAWFFAALYAGIFGGFLLFRGRLMAGLMDFAFFVSSGKANSGKGFPYAVALSLGVWTALFLS